MVPQRIGIVAAEPSGDLLAAGLMDALRERLPDVRFEGVNLPDDVFDGLMLQRATLKRDQQLAEWICC